MSDEAAGAAMSERVAGTNKPAPSAAADAATAERAATVDFSRRLQNASPSDAADMRKAADNARHAPPPAPPAAASSKTAPAQTTRTPSPPAPPPPRTPQSAKNGASAAATAQQYVDSMHRGTK